ncbi:MAG: SprT-like domain-containing protein [Halioglobus sp.]
MIEPIKSEQQQCVLDRTEYFMLEAEKVFGRKFKRIPVLFDLRGTTAGMYKVHGKRRWIRYNPWIFSKYFEANWRDTVPHEVAHYIIDIAFGRRAKPHGVEWKTLMARFEADPGVTFKLDLSGIPKRQQRTHPYHCLCQIHQVSTTRHNRVIRGRGRYHCRSCEGELVYAG